MKIDFIHIGFHKTASTFLQSKVFPKIQDLIVLNHQNSISDKWFHDNFVRPDAHSFDKTLFQKDFLTQFGNSMTGSGQRPILAISEENISGDIYTGLESQELMNRLYDVFGSTCILIVIRNQVDFLLSAYSNHIIHGGVKTISEWLEGEETRFGKIISKVSKSKVTT